MCGDDAQGDAQSANPLQDQVQGSLLQTVLDQPGTEVTKDREVEAWIVQFQAQEELPVHPGPHLFSGLPVAEPLRVLQHRDQRQRPGRDRRAPHTTSPAESRCWC